MLRRFFASKASFESIDHVCVCVSDIDASLAWYLNVLGFEHKFAEEPSFGKDPAFLQNGNAKVRLSIYYLQ